MAGTGAIFRVTNTGDNEGNVSSANKIEFNTGALLPDTTGRMIHIGFRAVRDINFHPNPRRDLDQIQDGRLGNLTVPVTGYFINHMTTGGPLNLFNWQANAASNGDFPFGRFGLRLTDFAGSMLDLTPSATIGYILYDVECDDLESPRDEIAFTLKVYRNGSI